MLADRSRSLAWITAGIAIAIALFEAVALAIVAPSKPVQPITLLVDRQTGYVQTVDPLQPKRLSADEALTNAYLAQYVQAREGFDRATVGYDYRRVALWSGGATRSVYLAHMPATNPSSPFQLYPVGTIVQARVKSVSRLNTSLAFVRFDTQLQDRSGRAGSAQPWISLVRFRYLDAPMRMEDRLINPLGFQVVGYRRDAEAPPPPPSALDAQARPPFTGAIEPRMQVGMTEAYRERSLGEGPARPRHVPPARPFSFAANERAVRRAPEPSLQPARAELREIPLNQIPLGSPLSPTQSPIGPALSRSGR